MPNFHKLEPQRVALQADLDQKKSLTERNKLGQFSTPFPLAQEILRHADRLLPAGPVRFLDPAFGTGAFYSALRNVYPNNRIIEAVGFEIDTHYGYPACALWNETGLNLRMTDFTRQTPEPRFNLLICNPPYVRHHHLTTDDKDRLQRLTAERCNIRINGLAGLYCHFIGLSHAWLAEDAIAGWLIPSEFMDVNYGVAIKHYLLEKVTLLHIHRFDPKDVQFSDALVSSAIVWFRNAPPPHNHTVDFSFGGTLSMPAQMRSIPVQALAQEPKWTRFPAAGIRLHPSGPILSDFFRIKRGIATGNNSFFILSDDEVESRNLPRDAFRPILPSPRHVDADEVAADDVGNPLLDRRLFLLDSRMSEAEIARHQPPLLRYLEEGKRQGVPETYLCRHRSPWYAQEDRPAAPIVCTYLGRSNSKCGRPFRFILNHSRATITNVYLAMYPTPTLSAAMCKDRHLIRRIWAALNRITPAQLLGEGRVYGGGLHKLEPRELANVPGESIAALLPAQYRPMRQERLPI
ncbi:MAG: Eco57I restriction-modification methylase domain-containing protein [Magnetococcales bacterium]|nr:Eco57I restriction-modification methylase domain-containing protein [Magnetococcales bacterium]